ncbi:MAG TPA: DUF4387 domain-containing protein [Candidatus Limnocylindria bacterium]|nr:DUF4387 domain-containing protein [Candidatus Limnocylindria bacterium]
MKKLHELAALVRSKNAGPFAITLDVIFPDAGTYRGVLGTGALDNARVAALYGVPEEDMRRYELPLANAVKFSYPRKASAGSFLDDDLYGCQQHAPLVMLDIPL